MNLNDFLVKAKLNGYCNPDVRPQEFADGRREYLFIEDNMAYHDAYHGENPFQGHELVWEDNIPIWGMVYRGRVISDSVPQDEIFDFLKVSLRHVDKFFPVRGPINYSRGEFQYILESSGDIEEFNGVERILHDRKEVYILRFEGGTIRS
ncbi:MAG: DUF5680 domain-containing protein [Candidatus Woesearchaeota archaeon]